MESGREPVSRAPVLCRESRVLTEPPAWFPQRRRLQLEKERNITEECFQQMVLEPALPTQDIVYGIVKFKPVPVEIKNRTTIPAVHVRTGTEPAGTMWIRNPIPACYGQLGGGEMSACDGPQFPPPIPGLFGFGPARCGAPALFQALYSKRVGTLRCNWTGQSLTVQHTLTPRHLKPCSRHHPQQLQPHPGAGQLREVLQLLASRVPALGRNKARESPAAFVLCLLVFCSY